MKKIIVNSKDKKISVQGESRKKNGLMYPKTYQALVKCKFELGSAMTVAGADGLHGIRGDVGKALSLIEHTMNYSLFQGEE